MHRENERPGTALAKRWTESSEGPQDEAPSGMSHLCYGPWTGGGGRAHVTKEQQRHFAGDHAGCSPVYCSQARRGKQEPCIDPRSDRCRSRCVGPPPSYEEATEMPSPGKCCALVRRDGTVTDGSCVVSERWKTTWKVFGYEICSRATSLRRRSRRGSMPHGKMTW